MNESPECTPPDDMEFRVNARRRLDFFVVQGGLCQHQRRQKPDGTAAPSDWPTWTNADNMHGTASLVVTERSCTIWVATLFTKPVAKRGSNRNEKLSFRHWRRRSSLDHGLTWTHGAPWAAAHSTRLHSRRRGSFALLFSDARRTRRGAGCGTSGASENQQVRESEGRS